MSIVNLGILAHVDAGKTTLTERLLYTAGAIRTIGSVDKGSTQTDTLALERQRGITIKSAVVSFRIGGVTVNLIDTPGHPDFIAEVERALSVLDGVVLVISAVEGVQVQTRVLMRALQRLRVPTLMFVNKIDCLGADCEAAVHSIAEKLTPAIVVMGSAGDLGSRDAWFRPHCADDIEFVPRLLAQLAEHDDNLLAAYLDDEQSVPYQRLRCELAAQTARAQVHPVFLGSAATGAGVQSLMAGIGELLPAAKEDTDGSLAGTIFKVERGPAGEKIAFARLSSGVLRTRDRLRFGRGCEGKVSALEVFDGGAATRQLSVAAGQIGKLWGLADVQIGDEIVSAMDPAVCSTDTANRHYFDPPTLETAIVPVHSADGGALHAALNQLAEQDPLINLRQDDLRGEMYVSLYGEVQKEVIAATLLQEYGIDVHFLQTSVICIERPISVGEAVERLGKGGNPFLATMGLRIEPAPVGTGIIFTIAAELRSIPLYIYNSVEEFHRMMDETVREALQQGLFGWQMTDCVVTLTESGYAAPASGAKDFRLVLPMVLMAALQQAGTEVYEPVQRFRLELPADSYGSTAPILIRLGAVVQSSTMRGSSYLLEGDIPATRIPELQHQLPAATRGEGVLETSFGGYQLAASPAPSRPRSDRNPLNRKEYLLHVMRGV